MICFDKARTLLKELVRDYADRPEFRLTLGTTCHNHGNELQQVGRRAEAWLAFERSSELFRELTAKDPAFVYYQEMVVRVALKLAGVHSADNHHKLAYEQAGQALEQARKLNQSQTKSPRYEQLVATCCTSKGESAKNVGALTEAEQLYREALGIREKYAKVRPVLTDAHYDAARAYRDLAELSRNDQPAEALALYEQCRGSCNEALRVSPQHLQAQSVMGQAWNGLGFCQAKLGRYADALKSFENAGEPHRAVFAKSPKQTLYRERLSEHYEHFSRVLRDKQRMKEAVELLLKRQQLWPDNAGELYRVACDLAQCAAGPTSPEAELALAALRQAIVQGYSDANQLCIERSFDRLRDRDDFMKLLGSVQKK